MMDAFVVSAARTPVGRFMGALSEFSAHDLGGMAIGAALTRAKLDPEMVSHVVMGQVLTAGQGQNPARQAASLAKIPFRSTAIGINQLCGAGLRAVAAGAESLAYDPGEIIVAGGQESMTRAPHAAYLRDQLKTGSLELIDTMLRDGLVDALIGGHMGEHTEALARGRGIDRLAQEIYSLASQDRALSAQQAGRFNDEIVPISVGDSVMSADETPRRGLTPEGLSKLQPAFGKDGTITAATASGLNDAAAAVVLASEHSVSKWKLEPLVRISSWATAGVHPAEFGLGPIPAMKKALARAGWKVEDVDLIECNEAYAAQTLAVIKDLNLDTSKVNVNGGAIALGHPIGASGARILCTLVHEMVRRDVKRGVAALCIGGGMGIAMCVER